ncbi:MAG: hypothetical protein IJB30_09070 [Clostridia bacterium]|nr:hypothetical protein [Clostridia bacterium]MBQ4611873.1 hypothetical protein [Clostridia bacterium]
MFGYIQPNKDELRFREYNEYRAYYCGLCKCIGREFGEPVKLALSYDCAFIAILLTGLAGVENTRRCRCVYKPLSGARMAAVEDEYIRFAADMDVILAYCKLDDNWRDDKKIGAAAGKAAMKGAFEKAKDRSPQLYRAIHEGIGELSRLEAENIPQIDPPADAFARMMKNAALAAPVENSRNRLALGHMLYHLGRWVYLIDAWEDREKDKKKGSYNPFLAAGADRERAEFIINCSLNEAINAYELLDIKAHESLLDNIIMDGCPAKNREVLGGKDDKSL